MKAEALAVTRSCRHNRVVAIVATLAALASVLLWTGTARGDELSDIPGAFADVGVGAGAMGMGGAVVASVRGASSLFWNPAGLATSERPREFALSYCDQLGLVPYSAGAATYRLGDYSLGVGLLYSGDEVLSETSLLLGAARQLSTPPWATDRAAEIGVTVKTRWASFGGNDGPGEQVTGSAMGLGLDLGALVPLTDTTTLGIAARDMVNVLNWDSSASGSYGENVPASIALGLAVRAGDNLLFEVDLDSALSPDVDGRLRAGVELELFDVASLRGGYRTALPDREAEEYSVGAGARIAAGTSVVSLDIAYLFGHLDDTLRFSLGFGL